MSKKSNIIQFPNSKPSEVVKAALKLEQEKDIVENTLQTAMLSPIWDQYVISDEDLKMLAQFGEVMQLHPLAAARLNAKLAEALKKVKSAFYELNLEDLC
jgi:hypothetical protein